MTWWELIVRAVLVYLFLLVLLRRSGFGGAEKVYIAILENNGQISVVPKSDAGPALGSAG